VNTRSRSAQETILHPHEVFSKRFVIVSVLLVRVPSLWHHDRNPSLRSCVCGLTWHDRVPLGASADMYSNCVVWSGDVVVQMTGATAILSDWNHYHRASSSFL
jgi:hypothetical protein